jgi:protein-S-isoprenylcysteine O-methyltransferase Ste14
VIRLRLTPTWSLAWDSLLCLLFFAQHSGMIRKPFRAWISRVVPGHSHGLIYTTASAIALLLLVVLWQPLEGYRLHGAGLWLSRGILLSCFAGIIWGIHSLGNFDAFGIEAFLAAYRRERPAIPTLVVKGPYRWVRHPFYFLSLMALWATPLWSWDRLLLNLLFTIWILCGARLEEGDLLTQFGEDYRLYQRTVPMFLPRVPASVPNSAGERSSAHPAGR